MASKKVGQKSKPKKTTPKVEPLDLVDPDPYESEPYECWGGEGMWTQRIENQIIESIIASAPAAAGPEFGPVLKGPLGWKVKPSTRDTYVERFRLVWREAAEYLYSDPSSRAMVTPMEVVERLIERGQLKSHGRLKLSSWQAYRNGVLWEFHRRAQTDGDYCLAVQRLELCRHPDPNNAKTLRDLDKAERTQKGGIPKRDLIKLFNQLRRMNRHVGWGARTLHWLQATIRTGIRPNEWEHTRWADVDRLVLLAPNSKEKADVAGLSRKFLVTEASDKSLPGGSLSKVSPTHLTMRAIPVDPSDRLVVQAHMDAVAAWTASGGPFETLQDRVGHTLTRACKALWGDKKSYSLYHARHQFAAEVKKKTKSRDEVARLMGHANPRTAHRRYAPSRVAHKKGPEQRAVHSAAESQNRGELPVQEDGAGSSQNNSDMPKER